MRTDREKVIQYETLLHDIQMYYSMMDSGKVKQLLENIFYAHRSGNGTLSDVGQQERIDRAFDKLCEVNQGE